MSFGLEIWIWLYMLFTLICEKLIPLFKRGPDAWLIRLLYMIFLQLLFDFFLIFFF